MIQFTLTSAGTTRLASASISSPVVINTIVLSTAAGDTLSITTFTGAIVPDESGVGNYAVIDFEDTSASAYTVNGISLKSDSIEIANSELVSIVKQSGKQLKVRLSAQFDGAEKCSFDSTTINLPYATSFRDGVIRLNNSTKDTSDSAKKRVVYSAYEIDTKLGGLLTSNGFVPWVTSVGNTNIETLNLVNDIDVPTKSVTISIDSSSKLNINSTLTGNVVASAPTIAAGSVTSSDKVVNEAYISSIYTNSVANNSTSLVTSGAVYSYINTNTASTITDSDTKLATADAVYEFINGTGNNLVHKSGSETIAGSKTFSDSLIASTSISSPSYLGDGVLSGSTTSAWSNAANNSKLPTMQATKSYADSLDSATRAAFAAADTTLQSQIDALNAGQNLADIVSTDSALAATNVANLKAQNDSGITIGDKVQVLADSKHNNSATVYELIKGVNPDSSVNITSTANSEYYWSYIGLYGSDAYTKADAEATFLAKTDATTTYLSKTEASTTYIQLSAKDTTIAATETNDTVPTSLAVYTYVSGEVSTLNSAIADCLPSSSLVTTISESSTNSQVPSALAVNNLVTSAATNYAKLNSNNTFTGSSNTFNAVSATTVTASGAITGASLNVNTGAITGGTITASTSVSSPSYTGTGVYDTYASGTWSTATNELPTVSAVKDAFVDELKTISTIDSVGSIGLFVYVGTSSFKGYGETVSGANLRPVGMTLPTSGQISYKSAALASPLTGTWKLLSLGLKSTTTEPCLVLAQKISE